MQRLPWASINSAHHLSSEQKEDDPKSPSLIERDGLQGSTLALLFICHLHRQRLQR